MRIRASKDGASELINISSMIDVMFILIIFFLVTTTFKEEEIDHMVNLPVDARNQSLTQSTGNLVKINIRKSGAYVLLGKQVTEEQITQLMDRELKKKPDLKVLIRSDQDAKLLYVANVLSICRHVGVNKANIALKTTTQ
jgi:biopolymer transport protein ExbD